ncbi:hypothetical protein JCM19037_348 [Geomicrobium sp. JCM 19037]|nr:hypothetical protein JCM19037_348 [Geomicrobium sp. JCM 19037]
MAEAMDTAQRGMGLGWSHAKELITRSVKEARAVGGEIACGAGTDQLLPAPLLAWTMWCMRMKSSAPTSSEKAGELL